MMKKRILSKIFFLYLFIISSSTLLILFWANHSFKEVLVKEKQSSMQKEAKLIARQYANDYFSGDITTIRLSQYFSELHSLLNSEIWLCDQDGVVLITSSKEDTSILGQQIQTLHPSLELGKPFLTVSDFSHTFPEPMISIGRPIRLQGKQTGYLMLHSKSSSLSSTQAGITKATYVSLGILLVIILLFMYYFSKKILVPIGEINHTARRYAKGDFDTLIPIERYDEIGELVSSLNFMATELSKTEQYRKDFISNISHDFRSPLTSIKGYLEAMLDGTIPPELYERYLGVLLDETNRLTKLTEGLVSLKTLNGNVPLLKLSNFDILKTIRSTMNTFEGQCEAKQVTIELSTTLSSCIVQADSTKIEQVVYNVIDNAIKFSKKGGHIKITVSELNHGKVSISIKDNGIGIPKSKQNRIWERFYKVDNSRGKDKKSHGIGLALTKEIIHAHNEQITLISTENVGSEFIFTLTKPKHIA